LTTLHERPTIKLAGGGSMSERKYKIADYLASFCVNVAAIGAGISLYKGNDILIIALSFTTLFLGYAILRRAYK
jgi:hypothetical protein